MPEHRPQTGPVVGEFPKITRQWESDRVPDSVAADRYQAEFSGTFASPGSGSLDHKDTEVGLPLMEPIQRIMIRTQIFQQCLRVNRTIEHSTQCQPIHDAAVNGKADDPAGKLIHHDQNPVTLQDRRFTAKQVQRPERVFSVTDEGEPGRTARSADRMEVN